MLGQVGQSESRGRDPSVVVFMSLYLILLTFFIVLAALSRIENKRSEQALIGLDRSFGGAGGRSAVTMIEPPLPQAESGREVAAALEQDLAALGALPFANISIERGEVSVRLPARLLFADSGSALSDLGRGILAAMGRAAREVGQPMSLSVLVARPVSFWGLAPAPIDRAASLRAALPEDLAASRVGIVEGQGAGVHFRFRRLAPGQGQGGAP